MIEAYKVEAIAVGNGTASRETEDFLKRQTFNREVQIFIVSEQGASIYSASKIARDFFSLLWSTSCWYCPTPMDFGSILTSSASGSISRRAMDTAPRTVTS